MVYIVQCKTPTQILKWKLRKGETAIVGSSPWADFCIESDECIRAEELRITYRSHDPRIQVLWLNGPPGPSCRIEDTLQNLSLRGGDRDNMERSLVIGKSILSFHRNDGEDRLPNVFHFEFDATKERNVSNPRNGDVPISVAPDLFAKQLIIGMGLHRSVHWLTSQLLKRLPFEDCGGKPALENWLSDPSSEKGLAIEQFIQWERNRDPWTSLFAAIVGMQHLDDDVLFRVPGSIDEPVSAMIEKFLASAWGLSCHINQEIEKDLLEKASSTLKGTYGNTTVQSTVSGKGLGNAASL